MPTVDVTYDDCQSAYYGESIQTIGLETCIGVCAYGLPSAAGGINKVMAHSLTGSVRNIIGGSFIREVRNSGMTVHGVCISKPNPAINDSLTNSQIKDLMEEFGILAASNLRRSDVTDQMIQDYKRGLKRALKDANDDAKAYCQALRAPITVVQRTTANGVMKASASPGGKVKADGSTMADIPDMPAESSSSRSNRGGHSSGGGSSSQYRSGGQSSSGHSSHHRSGGSSSTGDYSRSSGHSSQHRSGGSGYDERDYYKSSGGSSSSRHKSSRTEYSR